MCYTPQALWNVLPYGLISVAYIYVRIQVACFSMNDTQRIIHWSSQLVYILCVIIAVFPKCEYMT
jgi:hypothetical protein